MKLLFAHDHIFYKCNSKYYSAGGLSNGTLNRYTNIFKNMVVVSRQKEIKAYNHKLMLASTEGVKFVKIPNFKSIRNIYKLFSAKKIINNEVMNCDLLIARLPSSIGSIAISCAQKNKKSYLVEVVACAWDELWNHSLKGKIIAPYNYYITKKSIRNAPYVVYVTNEFLQKRYPTKGKNIGCSDVELPSLDDDILNKRLNKIRNMHCNKTIIIGTTAAVNVRYKGQKYVIKTLGKLKRQGITNFEYQLVGGGEQVYLKSIVKKYGVMNQVKFLGSIPHNKVFEWLDTIDIYIQPSRQEGLPRALIEAMSRGCPSLGSEAGGIPELLNGQFIFHNGAVDEICELLKKMNKETMTQEAKRSFEKAKEYCKESLDKKRNIFYKKFIEEIK